MNYSSITQKETQREKETYSLASSPSRIRGQTPSIKKESRLMTYSKYYKGLHYTSDFLYHFVVYYSR